MSATLAPEGGPRPMESTTRPSNERHGTPDRSSGPRARPQGRGWLTAPWPERYRPWTGRATRADLVLMSAFVMVLLLGIVTRPLKPFLLASHPVALELLSGDLLAIGAASAFARVGEVPLWLAVAAGVIGMVKLDWLMWWAGRAWGEGIIRMFTTGDRARHLAVRATEMTPWMVAIAVVAAVLPGIPTPLVYAMAGLAGMRLVTFLVLNTIGATVVTTLVAVLGYELGQSAVDVVLVVDRYASFVSITLITLTFLAPWVRKRLSRATAR